MYFIRGFLCCCSRNNTLVILTVTYVSCITVPTMNFTLYIIDLGCWDEFPFGYNTILIVTLLSTNASCYSHHFIIYCIMLFSPLYYLLLHHAILIINIVYPLGASAWPWQLPMFHQQTMQVCLVEGVSSGLTCQVVTSTNDIINPWLKYIVNTRNSHFGCLL